MKYIQQARIPRWFGWFALVCLSLYILSVVGLLPQRNILDTDQQLLPYKWSDFTQQFISLSFLPALLGSFLVRISRPSSLKKILIAEIILGILCAAFGYYALGFMHLGCGSSCAGQVPSYSIINVIISLYLTIWVVAPSVLLAIVWGNHKNPSN